MTDGNAPPKCRTTGQWHLKPTAAGAGRQCRPYLLGELTKLLRYLGDIRTRGRLSGCQRPDAGLRCLAVFGEEETG
jgi:hypothetical protein